MRTYHRKQVAFIRDCMDNRPKWWNETITHHGVWKRKEDPQATNTGESDE